MESIYERAFKSHDDKSLKNEKGKSANNNKKKAFYDDKEKTTWICNAMEAFASGIRKI